MTESDSFENVIVHDEDFDPPDGLEDRYAQTLLQTAKILTDEEDLPQGFHLSIHRGNGIGHATGMSPELVEGVGPTQPAVEMLAQHLSTVHQQTQGMDVEELAMLAASQVKQLNLEGDDGAE